MSGDRAGPRRGGDPVRRHSPSRRRTVLGAAEAHSARRTARPRLPYVEVGALVGMSESPELVEVTFHTPLSPPCHPAARVVGSAARAWCPVCRREFQADDPELTPIGDLSEMGGAMSTGERRRLLGQLSDRVRAFGLLGGLSGGSVPVLFVDDPRWPPSRRAVTLRQDNGEWSYWWANSPIRIAPVSQLPDAAQIVAYAMSRTAGIGTVDSDVINTSPDTSAGTATIRDHHEGGGQP